MNDDILISGPLARDLALKEAEELYNHNHGKGGRFAPSGGAGSKAGFSPGVAAYLQEQYQMSPETAKGLGLRQDGTRLMIPFKNEQGRVTSYKWRDTAVLTGPGRWGPAKSQGLSIYENKSKSGPLFVVESPSEGLILAAHNQRVVFFDGADSLVSRTTGKVNPRLHTRLVKLTKSASHSILIPDNDVRGEEFAKVVEPLVTRRVNPPPAHKDLRSYLLSTGGSLDKLIS